jgi:hypothetical protein
MDTDAAPTRSMEITAAPREEVTVDDVRNIRSKDGVLEEVQLLG